jgi:hypothetical protein
VISVMGHHRPPSDLDHLQPGTTNGGRPSAVRHLSSGPWPIPEVAEATRRQARTPVVLPVNYAVMAGTVVVRTSEVTGRRIESR